MNFTLRSLFILVAMVAAYCAGWGTARSKYESSLYGMSHELTNAVNEARDASIEKRNAVAAKVEIQEQLHDALKRLIDCQQQTNSK